VYRDKLEEIRKAKGISYKQWDEMSGVSVDTICRIIHPEKAEKDSPHVNTLDKLCAALGVELWEIFYNGDQSFVVAQAELAALRAERDALIADKAVLTDKVYSLRERNEALKDELLDLYKHHHEKEGK
jgi:transcriptional regulator with XRE-family HTH domain